jgi:hypothetical protein
MTLKSQLLLIFTITGLFALTCCSPQNAATDSCPNTSCQNSGTVTLTDTICSCACGNGFTGDSCQYNALGSYNTLRVNTTNGATTNMVVSVTAVSGGLSIGIVGATILASYSASNAFSIGTQTVSGVVYSGTGTFTPHNLRMNLTEGGVAYTYQGTHQ